ncbi:MAG TPA: plastocyanin/azurin family copper-binding protein [Oligoflexus sp.]|uniref:plastocyanin/azurin family copper-binding protein n=1 Tax=Oligoflexus sp. TaxID=1971216 RepID=UPI002D8000CF|nr:plastocyanin/azurin family copper-binding protein [Oligoflexus sp.]HET9238246.1 plastocyanin/azurin family copper-binding protein [Oligoflexus sp.]
MKTFLMTLSVCFAAGNLFTSAVGHGKPNREIHHVRIKNMVFEPALLQAKAGDMIQWTNEDIVPHTATGPNFDSGPIAPGVTWTVTLNEAGIIAYKCSYHPTMVARVQVSPPSK